MKIKYHIDCRNDNQKFTVLALINLLNVEKEQIKFIRTSDDVRGYENIFLAEAISAYEINIKLLIRNEILMKFEL